VISPHGCELRWHASLKRCPRSPLGRPLRKLAPLTRSRRAPRSKGRRGVVSPLLLNHDQPLSYRHLRFHPPFAHPPTPNPIYLTTMSTSAAVLSRTLRSARVSPSKAMPSPSAFAVRAPNVETKTRGYNSSAPVRGTHVVTTRPACANHMRKFNPSLASAHTNDWSA
jgi:hypothetical protein